MPKRISTKEAISTLTAFYPPSGWAEGVFDVWFCDKLPNNTPAMLHCPSGIVLVDTEWFRNAPIDHRVWLLLHEWAHATLKTTDELKADELAFKEYAKLGYSLRESILVIKNMLNFTRDEHYFRSVGQLERAAAYQEKIGLGNPLKPKK